MQAIVDVAAAFADNPICPEPCHSALEKVCRREAGAEAFVRASGIEVILANLTPEVLNLLTYLLTYSFLTSLLHFLTYFTCLLPSFLPSLPPTYFPYLPQRMTVESLIPAVGCLDRLCRSDENVDLIKNAGGIDTLLGVLDFCGDNETFTAEVISLIFHFII